MTEEQAAAELMRQQALAETDEFLADIRARRAERAGQAERTPPVVEVPERHTRAPESQERPQRRVGRDWPAEQRWVEQIIDQHLGAATKKHVTAVAESLGGGVGEELAVIAKRERELWRGELTAALDQARTEFRAELAAAEARIRIAYLEQKLLEAEQRAAPRSAVPRLIGGSDAAD
jgi:hypothetical protein